MEADGRGALARLQQERADLGGAGKAAETANTTASNGLSASKSGASVNASGSGSASTSTRANQ